jgi:hypothetical protein
MTPRRAWPVWTLLGACVRLRLRGARVRAARLLPSPAIVIDPPPAGLFGAHARAPGGTARRPCFYCTARFAGIPITWTED